MGAFVPRQTRNGWVVEYALLLGGEYHTASMHWRSKTSKIGDIPKADLCVDYEIAQALANKRNGVTRK